MLVVVGESVDRELFGLFEGFLVAQLRDELVGDLLPELNLRVPQLTRLFGRRRNRCLQLLSHLRSSRGAILRAHMLIFKVTPLSFALASRVRRLGLLGAAIFVEAALEKFFKSSLAILAAFGQRGSDSRLIQIRLKEGLQEVEVVLKLLLRRNRRRERLGCRVGPPAGWLTQKLGLDLRVGHLLLLDLDGRHKSEKS